MTMERNNRRDLFDHNGGNGSGSYREHNEHMREFCRSHVQVVMANAVRRDESALLERTRLLQVSYPMMETGGLRLLDGTTDWSALIPLWKVAPYKLSQN